MENPGQGRRSAERGFALILAILSLMLLTFLGLTLATTTSTELQIATNYRWSQQALYNAEAGLEAARLVLSNGADLATGWTPLLPTQRPGTWLQGAAPAPLDPVIGRDFERAPCDTKGGVGYGRVLADAATRYENVAVFPTVAGQTLNGAFTIWIRRGLAVANNGRYSDDTRHDSLVIVAEGIAPYMGPGDAFTRARQATRVLETRFTLSLAEPASPAGRQAAGAGGRLADGRELQPLRPRHWRRDGQSRARVRRRRRRWAHRHGRPVGGGHVHHSAGGRRIRQGRKTMKTRRASGMRPMGYAAAMALAFALTGDRSLAVGVPASVYGQDPLEVLELKVRPNVFVVLDSSGSMQEMLPFPAQPPTVANATHDMGSGDHPRSKLRLAKEVLRSVIANNQAKVSFLFGQYTQSSSRGLNNNNAGTRPRARTDSSTPRTTTSPWAAPPP